MMIKKSKLQERQYEFKNHMFASCSTLILQTTINYQLTFIS